MAHDELTVPLRQAYLRNDDIAFEQAIAVMLAAIMHAEEQRDLWIQRAAEWQHQYHEAVESLKTTVK